jgi:hypothetical protein
MFINTAVYERLLSASQALSETLADERHRHDLLSEQAAQQLAMVRQDLGTERGRREVLSQTTAVQKGFIEFLCSRVNQLETERVLLLRQFVQLDLPAPMIRPSEPAAAAAPGGDGFADVSIFDDDPRHAPAGWHPDGSVNYGSTPAPTGGMSS